MNQINTGVEEKHVLRRSRRKPTQNLRKDCKFCSNEPRQKNVTSVLPSSINDEDGTTSHPSSQVGVDCRNQIISNIPIVPKVIDLSHVAEQVSPTLQIDEDENIVSFLPRIGTYTEEHIVSPDIHIESPPNVIELMDISEQIEPSSTNLKVQTTVQPRKMREEKRILRPSKATHRDCKFCSNEPWQKNVTSVLPSSINDEDGTTSHPSSQVGVDCRNQIISNILIVPKVIEVSHVVEQVSSTLQIDEDENIVSFPPRIGTHTEEPIVSPDIHIESTPNVIELMDISEQIESSYNNLKVQTPVQPQIDEEQDIVSPDINIESLPNVIELMDIINIESPPNVIELMDISEQIESSSTCMKVQTPVQPQMDIEDDLVPKNPEEQDKHIRIISNVQIVPPFNQSQKFKLIKQLCEECNLPPPLPFDEFDSIDWNHVSKTEENLLMSGYKFQTPMELERIPRRHPKFPFCHPGPVRDDETGTDGWYYADSIVQEVKFSGQTERFYNVRWIGYEDNYNTLESETSLKGTSILTLFQRKDIYLASHANGPMLLRRSIRKVKITAMFLTKTISLNETYGRTMAILDGHLKEEELAKRYLPELGFYSCVNLDTALGHQLLFTKKVFLPLIKSLNRTEHHLSENYLGSIFGPLNNAESLKSFKSVAKNKGSTVARWISKGLEGKPKDNENFVSFFVATRRDRHQKATDKNLDLHLCVYTIRSHGKYKDSIYFDPVPPCYKRTVPDFLLKMRDPKLRSATRISGGESVAHDGLYQCFKYLIGLHTDEINFEPNLKSKYFVLKN